MFAVEAIPQTVIIDRNGKIAFVNVGNSTNLDSKLSAAIDFLLKPASDQSEDNSGSEN